MLSKLSLALSCQTDIFAQLHSMLMEMMFLSESKAENKGEAGLVLIQVFSRTSQKKGLCQNDNSKADHIPFTYTLVFSYLWHCHILGVSWHPYCCWLTANSLHWLTWSFFTKLAYAHSFLLLQAHLLLLSTQQPLGAAELCWAAVRLTYPNQVLLLKDAQLQALRSHLSGLHVIHQRAVQQLHQVHAEVVVVLLPGRGQLAGVHVASGQVAASFLQRQ